jgi:hypothetical protein
MPLTPTSTNDGIVLTEVAAAIPQEFQLNPHASSSTWGNPKTGLAPLQSVYLTHSRIAVPHGCENRCKVALIISIISNLPNFLNRPNTLICIVMG